MWTLADVVCEYRTCHVCKSTRPYIKPLAIEGQVIMMYHDPISTVPVTYTLEDVERTETWDNLLDAIAMPPGADVAELRRNGVVLARAICAIDGVVGWKVLSPDEM
jgi:hypothetical protein